MAAIGLPITHSSVAGLNTSASKYDPAPPLSPPPPPSRSAGDTPASSSRDSDSEVPLPESVPVPGESTGFGAIRAQREGSAPRKSVGGITARDLKNNPALARLLVMAARKLKMKEDGGR